MKTYKEIKEDSYASDFKVKKFLGPDGKWQERKLRPHRVEFKASKMRGEPAQDDDRGDVGMKEETTPYWKKASFNKRMSALAKQERLAREKKEAEKKQVKEEADTKTEHDLGYKHASQGKKSNPYNPGSPAHSAYESGHETYKRHFGEETNMTIDEQINEVLSKDATAGDWIHDFVHSDNPKFDGKSKDKRKQMALAAYYAKQRNEEVEPVEENAPVAPVPDKKYIKGTPEYKAYMATKKPHVGHPTNVKEGTMKSFKEMVQSLDEKSEQAKQNKTMKNMMDASRGARYKLNNPVPPADPEHKTAQAHNKAIGRALRNEEEKKEDLPFDGPYTKTPGTTKDKSGAVHTPMSKARHLARMAMKKQMKEDIDRLFEAKDESEYGYEGDMAMSQLKTICRHSEHFMEMLKPDTDLPEWVQSKITLATDYIQTAHDYMMSEMNEELKGNQHKLDKNKNGKVDSHDFKILRGETCSDCGKAPCECGTVKESDEVETRNLSFKDFITQLNEYTPGPGGVTRVQGRSYGAQYRDPEGEDDADDKKKQVAKPEPAVKRGRGRPAGSKSGANQKVTTGKKGSGVDYTGYKLHLPNTNR